MTQAEGVTESDRYHQLYEQAVIGIYRSSREGHAVYANPAFVRLMGYEAESDWVAAIGSIEREWYVDPGRRAEFVAAMDQAGEVQDFVSEIYRHRTGERIWVSETARAVRGPDGQVAYYEGTVTDITDRKRAEDLVRQAAEAERRAARAKDLFFSSVTHELRAPLTAILGYAELLQEELDGHPSACEDLRRIIAAAQHQLAVVNDILDLAKIEAGRLQVVIEDVDLPSLAGEVYDLFERAASARANRLVIRAEPCRIRSDRLRIKQCLVNLVSNACKFTEGGTVTLEVETDGRFAALSVQDTGIGMTDEERGRLFVPFSQAQPTTAGRYGGSGLGLALTRSIAEHLGGTLDVQTCHGRGSTFTLRLPALPCDVGQATR